MDTRIADVITRHLRRRTDPEALTSIVSNDLTEILGSSIEPAVLLGLGDGETLGARARKAAGRELADEFLRARVAILNDIDQCRSADAALQFYVDYWVGHRLRVFSPEIQAFTRFSHEWLLAQCMTQTLEVDGGKPDGDAIRDDSAIRFPDSNGCTSHGAIDFPRHVWPTLSHLALSAEPITLIDPEQDRHSRTLVDSLRTSGAEEFTLREFMRSSILAVIRFRATEQAAIPSARRESATAIESVIERQRFLPRAIREILTARVSVFIKSSAAQWDRKARLLLTLYGATSGRHPTAESARLGVTERTYQGYLKALARISIDEMAGMPAIKQYMRSS